MKVSIMFEMYWSYIIDEMCYFGYKFIIFKKKLMYLYMYDLLIIEIRGLNVILVM